MWQKTFSGAIYDGYANETLYDFALVFYVLLFFIQLIKKKYKVFQMIVFI